MERNARRDIPINIPVDIPKPKNVRDIELVMSQSGASYEKAEQALLLKNGDIVDAILYLDDGRW